MERKSSSIEDNVKVVKIAAKKCNAIFQTVKKRNQKSILEARNDSFEFFKKRFGGGYDDDNVDLYELLSTCTYFDHE